ncbi:MORC family CW-type zinc finger protein 3a isoform X1 [Perca fluviatilis]|uniref:MORC family CW-type zinc finger protein 3a isoform X1 n=1 Tax=Perca fluviatilis TaxID=8168 RepID=UPI001963BA95|nr:MORC family CW-type zinc finger protein 3a isoform X1 [Perca fluviatilis]
MAAQTDRGVPLSTLCPKFLHTNSTSHTWPFSAIAELIDNAYDPDVSAKQFWIDKTVVKDIECLTFMDNGNGLDHETMHKMLSFGYSDKTALKGVKPIGMYGNGFKSGSMRLGKDAIVFSKSKSVSCVGMLSQTYLEEIGANQISVPIVCFEQREKNKFKVKEEHKASLQDILRYSPFKTQEELLVEIDAISAHSPIGKTGTQIIIWNLRRTSTGTTEFDLAKDRYDIRIPSDIYESMKDTSQQSDIVTSYIPESFYSLRAYCSILYLKPIMQIIIRGQKVKSQLIAKSLAFVRKDHYKPTFLTKRIPITFGYNTKSKDQYGIMMYHKNRLIKAYERVGCQLKANNKGVGVIGVIECYFLEPTHNKQSFNETDKYRKTMTNLGTKLEEYWNEICYRRKTEDPTSTIPVEDTKKQPDQNWVQCDDCLRWRKLPDGIDSSKLPDKWFCRMNPDPQFRSCQAGQEPVDSDEEQPSYCKTYKQQERKDKKKQEMERQKAEEDRKRQEEQRLADLSRQKQAQKRLKTVDSPYIPTTPRSRFKTNLTQGGAARAESSPLRSSTISQAGGAVRAESSPLTSSILSQAACSPSSSSGLPVISSVCSLSPALLSTGHLRGKRTQPVTPHATPKRPKKMNGFHRGNSNKSTLVDVSPVSSPSVLIDDGDDDDDDTDDDICILEAVSDPRPKKPDIDLNKVKTEQEQSDANVSMLMECSDDAAVEDTSEMNVAGTGLARSAAVATSPSPVPSTGVTSSTTQTEVPKVKQEEEDQNQTQVEAKAGQSTSNERGREQSSGVDMGVCSVEQQSVIKQESGDAHSENRGKQTLQNGVMRHLDGEEDAGPSCSKRDSPLPYPSVTEVQEQQDQLIDLMQATAQERDSFKEQVHTLTCQLQDLQSQLQELSQINVKKECSHQASQTEITEEGEDYKSLFEKAKQKVDELIKDKEALLAATEPSTAQGDDMDEIALQVDSLIRKLDERNKERDELRSQLNSLEEEKANLASQCEELRLSLQQQREKAQERSPTQHRVTDSTVQTDPEEAGGTVNSGIDSSSDASRSLIELRHNIGRLLVSFVPFLELDQVNYECNVIDEILEQVLSDVDAIAPVGLRNRGTEQ